MPDASLVRFLKALCERMDSVLFDEDDPVMDDFGDKDVSSDSVAPMLEIVAVIAGSIQDYINENENEALLKSLAKTVEKTLKLVRAVSHTLLACISLGRVISLSPSLTLPLSQSPPADVH